MTNKRFIPFLITGIDSLGQGVSKLSERVTFIPKTTIGDEGEAEVMSEKKGVTFARLKTLNKSAASRIKPLCEHFDSCPSCHFQHVSYEEELQFKKESFKRLMRKLPLPEVEVIGAPQRLNYRNRIQLHYSLKSKLIGMRDPQTFSITPIPECLIGLNEIKREVKRLYENEQWMKEAPLFPQEGHVEIYWFNNELNLSWNRPYAEGGFTQVYESMNQKLKTILKDSCTHSSPLHILDLFGGSGNLSDQIPFSERLVVDIYSDTKDLEFVNQDLYSADALKKVAKEISRRRLKINHLLLDPPRSGLKELKLWIETIKPEKVVYVSCDPHTMARDLAGLEGYNYSRSFLFDFFPSTFHFESMIFLERKG